MMSLLSQPFSPTTTSSSSSSVSGASGLFFHPYSSGSDGQQSPAAAAATPKDRPFLCEEPGCGRRFNRKFTLSEHMKTHTGEKPYVCPLAECSRRFSTSGNLARHKRLHASLKPFECDINGCKRSFPSQEKLDHHTKIHMGRRTHSCRVPGCTKTFSTAGNLTRHIKNRHPELTQSAFPSYQYAHHHMNVLPDHRPSPPMEMVSPALLPATTEIAPKMEPVSLAFSPDAVELAFHEELSTFQATGLVMPMASTPQSVAMIVDQHCHHHHPVTDPTAAADISRCSMSVLDEVIEFELTKDV